MMKTGVFYAQIELVVSKGCEVGKEEVALWIGYCAPQRGNCSLPTSPDYLALI